MCPAQTWNLRNPNIALCNLRIRGLVGNPKIRVRVRGRKVILRLPTFQVCALCNLRIAQIHTWHGTYISRICRMHAWLYSNKMVHICTSTASVHTRCPYVRDLKRFPTVKETTNTFGIIKNNKYTVKCYVYVCTFVSNCHDTGWLSMIT